MRLMNFIEDVKQKYCNKLIESGQYAFVEQLNEWTRFGTAAE